MKTKCIQIKALTLFLLLFSIARVGNAQELKKSGRYYTAEITNSFKVKGTGSLRLYDIHGDVKVIAWDKNEALIHEYKKMDVFTKEEAKTILEKAKSSYQQNGNDIEVGGEHYRRDWVTSDFSISVPHSFSLDISTQGGDISITGIEGNTEIHTSGGEIKLKDISGEVNAKTSGGDIILQNCKGAANLKTSGGDLELSNITGPLRAKTSGGDISLRGAGSEVEIGTSGGSIDVSEVSGRLEAHTSGGDIELSDIKADADVHTSGGDIEFRKIDGHLQAATSGGDIKGKNVNGNADVSTSGGSIDLQDVKGAVDGKTAGGDITIEVTLEDFKKEHGAQLRTSGGEITIYLPENIPARILAEIEQSNRWENYNIYSDFPLTSVREEQHKRRGKKSRYTLSEGEINGGGDLIELYTVNGDIHIKKIKR